MERSVGNRLLRLKLANIFFGMAEAVFAYRVLFLDTHGLSATSISYVMSAANIVAVVMPMLASLLARKLKSKFKVFVGGVSLMLIACACMPSVAGVRVAGMMLGIIMIPMMTVCMNASMNMLESVSVTASVSYQGFDYSIVRICLAAGYTSANFLFTPIVKALGVNATFYIACIYLVALLVFSGSVRDFENVPPEIAEANAGTRRMEDGTPKDVYGNFYLMLFVCINIFYSIGGTISSYMVYLLQHIKADTSLVGTFTGARVIGEIGMLFLMPWLRRHFSIPKLLVCAAVVACVEMSLYQFVQSPAAVVAVSMMGGMARGLLLGNSLLYLRLMTPDNCESITIALWLVSTSVCSLVGMLVFGPLVDNYGILAVYRFALWANIAWLVLFNGGYLFGKHVLKKPPIISFKGISM